MTYHICPRGGIGGAHGVTVKTRAQAIKAALAMGDPVCVYRRERNRHWSLDLDRSKGDGTTFIRVGYGGVIVESLADAMRRIGPHKTA